MTAQERRQGGWARTVRELVPIALAAGGASLAVTLVVGGTTADLTTPTPIPPWPLGTTAGPVTGPEVSSRPAADRRAAAAAAREAALAAAGPLTQVLDLLPDRPVALVRFVAADVAGESTLALPAPVALPVAEPATAIALPAPTTAPPELAVATAPTKGKGKAKALKPEPPRGKAAGQETPSPSELVAADAPPNEAEAEDDDVAAEDHHPGVAKGHDMEHPRGNGPHAR